MIRNWTPPTEEEFQRQYQAATRAGLRWEEDDVDLSVPGVIAYFLDLDRWAPRYMGQRTTETKARAARENGMKGGRRRGASRSPRTGVVKEDRAGGKSGTGPAKEK